MKNKNEILSQITYDNHIHNNDFKICPNCDIFYDINNFCSKCGKKTLKLTGYSKLTKICPKCNHLYEDRYNFCTGCAGKLTDLDSYIKNLTRICPACGRRYSNDTSYCICENKLETINIPIRNLKLNINNAYDTRHKYNLENLTDILTEDNFSKLDTVLKSKSYNRILDNIKDTAQIIYKNTINIYSIDTDNLNLLDKILLIVKSFVEVNYKKSGEELGAYEFNKINLDDRLYIANQITTLIHELSHHLMNEIFRQYLMKLWNSNKTYNLELYVWFSLVYFPEKNLMDEYCAHTVEGRFTPHGYQDYSSFENILDSFEGNNENLALSILTGNTFSKDILTIIESFIDYEIREEIKEQFKKDYTYPPHYNGITNETDDLIVEEGKLSYINETFKSSFPLILNSKEYLNEKKLNKCFKARYQRR